MPLYTGYGYGASGYGYGMSSANLLYIAVIVLMFVGMWAQGHVSRVFQAYSGIRAKDGRSAGEVAMELLRREGNNNVSLARISGALTDNYDPRTETLNLSDAVYASNSVSALAVAAHEAGHAMQKFTGYAPLVLRSAAVPVCNWGSRMSMPIFIAGLIFSFRPLVYVGIVLFAFAVVFSLITLPVEFDASRRGLQMLTSGGYLSMEDEIGARKVLRAAALTYVISALSAVVQLLRLIAIANSGNNRRRR